MPWLETKAWWKSRTVWLGVVAALIGAGEMLTDGAILGPEATEWALVAVGCLGIVLRKMTNTAIEKAD